MPRPRTPEPYKCLNVYLYEHHFRWLGNRNRSKVIRNLIDVAIDRETRHQWEPSTHAPSQPSSTAPEATGQFTKD